MPLIVWEDTMKVGVPAVDFEHEELIGMINELGDLIEDGATVEELQKILGRIHALIEAHFALEEKIMREQDYPGYEAHKEDHENLLEAIRDIMDDVSASNAADISASLGERLTIWFSEHFRTLDRAFHNFD